MSYNNGDEYEGEWKRGKKNGFGTERWINGEMYRGEYRDGKRHGQATVMHANGDLYVGSYVNGEKQGQGEMRYALGSYVYKGEWSKNGVRHGHGLEIVNGTVTYEGEWRDDQKVNDSFNQV